MAHMAEQSCGGLAAAGSIVVQPFERLLRLPRAVMYGVQSVDKMGQMLMQCYERQSVTG
jgi:hypothetical protein